MTAAPKPSEAPGGAGRSALVDALQGIMSQWTSPAFITAIAARADVRLDSASLVAVTLLGAYGAQRPSDLAARLSTGASNISKIAARLQDAGLLERLVDPADSRAKLLALTPAGKQAADALAHAGQSLAADLVGEWSAEDQGELLRLVQRLEVETLRVAKALRNDAE